MKAERTMEVQDNAGPDKRLVCMFKQEDLCFIFFLQQR